MWSMWFQALFNTSLSSTIPDFIRKVIMNKSSSSGRITRHVEMIVLDVCVCVHSVYWNRTLQGWTCGVHLSPTWTPPRWEREWGHRPPGSLTVEVMARSSLKRYNATVWWDIWTFLAVSGFDWCLCFLWAGCGCGCDCFIRWQETVPSA